MSEQVQLLQSILGDRLNFHTVPAIHDQAQQVSVAQGVLDLSAVRVVDSAGLALLVHWKTRFPGLRYTGMPESLNHLASMSNTTWVFES